MVNHCSSSFRSFDLLFRCPLSHSHIPLSGRSLQCLALDFRLGLLLQSAALFCCFCFMLSPLAPHSDISFVQICLLSLSPGLLLHFLLLSVTFVSSSGLFLFYALVRLCIVCPRFLLCSVSAVCLSDLLLWWIVFASFYGSFVRYFTLVSYVVLLLRLLYQLLAPSFSDVSLSLFLFTVLAFVTSSDVLLLFPLSPLFLISCSRFLLRCSS